MRKDPQRRMINWRAVGEKRCFGRRTALNGSRKSGPSTDGKIAVDGRRARFTSDTLFCGRSSVGRAPPCQGGRREFESLRPLHFRKTAGGDSRGFFASKRDTSEAGASVAALRPDQQKPAPRRVNRLPICSSAGAQFDALGAFTQCFVNRSVLKSLGDAVGRKTADEQGKHEIVFSR
jgi:hypothetical protein